MTTKQLQKAKLNEDPSDSDSDYEYSDEEEIASLANEVRKVAKDEEKAKKKKAIDKIRKKHRERKEKRAGGCPVMLTTGGRAGKRCKKKLHRLRNGGYSDNLAKFNGSTITIANIPTPLPSKYEPLPPPPPPPSINDFTLPTVTTNAPLPATQAPTTSTTDAAGAIDAGGDTTMEDIEKLAGEQPPLPVTTQMIAAVQKEFGLPTVDPREEERRAFAELEKKREKEEEERLIREFEIRMKKLSSK